MSQSSGPCRTMETVNLTLRGIGFAIETSVPERNAVSFAKHLAVHGKMFVQLLRNR
jgi:hypothetical protein